MAFFKSGRRSLVFFPDAKQAGQRDLGQQALIVLLCICVTIGSVGMSTHQVQAGSSAAKEYQVKAAFLYNFAKFVQWPDSAFVDAQTPVCIGIVGRDPFGEALNGISAKTVQDRPLEIRRFQNVQDIAFCHILFINPEEKEHIGPILGTLQGRSILTVSETEHFTQAGGMVNFVVQGKKIHLEINPVSAERAGLKISAKLLQLATIIESDPAAHQPSLAAPPVYPLQAVGR